MLVNYVTNICMGIFQKDLYRFVEYSLNSPIKYYNDKVLFALLKNIYFIRLDDNNLS